MKRLLKLLYLLPMMLFAASCSNEDEPLEPHQDGEVENGFFTNLITSAETQYFESIFVESFEKKTGETEWTKVDYLCVGGIPIPSLLFHKGGLYFEPSWMDYECLSGTNPLYLLYYELGKAGRVYPKFFISSSLDYNVDKRELTYRYQALEWNFTVISTESDRFRVSQESNYTSSVGAGTHLDITDYIKGTNPYSMEELEEAIYFKSYKDFADYIVDEAEKYIDFHSDNYTLEDIREHYSSEEYQ
ncbi:MAG: hypothetical protein HDT06_01190 [Bacteroidales bacterium]|nr:hypothetical protein [Bacteroidales bacterium]